MRDLGTSPDIIKSAQQLLDGATTAPWEWSGYSLESEHGMVLDFQCVTEFGMNGATREVEVTPEDEELIAAAPEFAQAIAEETWEYTQVIYFNGKWQPIYEDLWYDNPEECESLFLDIEPWKWNNEPVRIVRRRVSPPEVIE